jgi:hypothetical protein
VELSDEQVTVIGELQEVTDERHQSWYSLFSTHITAQSLQNSHLCRVRRQQKKKDDDANLGV